MSSSDKLIAIAAVAFMVGVLGGLAAGWAGPVSAAVIIVAIAFAPGEQP